MCVVWLYSTIFNHIEAVLKHFSSNNCIFFYFKTKSMVSIQDAKTNTKKGKQQGSGNSFSLDKDVTFLDYSGT